LRESQTGRLRLFQNYAGKERKKERLSKKYASSIINKERKKVLDEGKHMQVGEERKKERKY
jgi:hypothetical protein